MGTGRRRTQTIKTTASKAADEARKIWSDLADQDHDETFLGVLNRCGFIHSAQLEDDEILEDFDISEVIEQREARIWEKVSEANNRYSDMRNERDFLRKIVSKMAGKKIEFRSR